MNEEAKEEILDSEKEHPLKIRINFVEIRNGENACLSYILKDWDSVISNMPHILRDTRKAFDKYWEEYSGEDIKNADKIQD